MSALENTEHRPNEKELLKNAQRERWTLLGLASPAVIMVLVIMVLPVSWLFYLPFPSCLNALPICAC
jgi:hypothetical protein